MATQKTKKTVKVIKPLRVSEEAEVSTTTSVASNNKSNYSLIYKLVLIALFGTLSYLLAFKYRSLILAGTVNNSPISRMELNQKLAERYGKQTFEEMVNEKLLAEQIKKNGIVVTDEEVNADVEKMIKQYGSPEAFKSALEQFGLTEEKARVSIKQSIGFKKLIEKSNKIEITDEAVKAYFDSNKETYKGKKIEDVSAEIKDSLYQQELYTKSQEMFGTIRKDAKVNSFI